MRSPPVPPGSAATAAAWPQHGRLLRWTLLLLAVLLLHGLVLVAVRPGGDRAAGVLSPQRPPALTLLTLAPRAPLPAQAELPMPTSAERPSERPADAPVAKSGPSRRLASATPEIATASQAGSAGEPAPLPIVSAATQPEPEASPSAAELVVPVYVTQLPGSADLHYQLRRGNAVGSGQLQWQRRGETYELSLQGELQGLPVLGSLSRGVIDIDGVAPVRLADRRRSRELRAANFQRDTHRITFSGPQTEYPLVAGAQDRLSWMIQLPAILEADPALTLTGARVTLFVVGTRGDAEAWHFEVQGQEALDLPAGAVANAVRLLREPRRPYDTRIEVWLDPARQHLPVRAVVTTVPGGQPLEMNLSRVVQAGL